MVHFTVFVGVLGVDVPMSGVPLGRNAHHACFVFLQKSSPCPNARFADSGHACPV